MSKLTVDKLRTRSVKRATRYDNNEQFNLAHWAIALGAEVGDVLNLIKKTRRGDHISLEEIGKELASVVIYADLMASHLGLKLDKLIQQKFNEVSDRIGSDVKL